MSLRTKLTPDVRRSLAGAAFAILVGLALSRFPIGEGLARLSYDLPFAFSSQAVPEDLIIVKMDEASNVALEQTSGLWQRTIHARLLDKLKADGSGVVVFDVFFRDPGNPRENAELARAIKAHGKVVLAAGLEAMSQPRTVGTSIQAPRKEFREAATAWGIVDLPPDADLTIRMHPLGTEQFPSLSWVAALLAKAPRTNSIADRERERWIRYYGPDGTIRPLSYYSALNMPNGYFKGKTVFVGFKPPILRPGEPGDMYPTPYTRWTRGLTSGVEIHGTIFLNLMRDDWLGRLSPAKESWILVLAGFGFGFGLSRVSPWWGAGLALIGSLAIAFLAILLVWEKHVWFPWMIVCGVQVPFALVWAVLSYTTTLNRQKQRLEKKIATAQAPVASTPPVAVMQPVSESRDPVPIPGRRTDRRTHEAVWENRAPIPIPDHTLVERIGQGSYGEVWLARNAIGTYHAAKIIFRHNFDTAESYGREFNGIQKYMPISLTHSGLLHILHVGRNDEAGYYYYIMEAGDDEVTGQHIHSARYSPRNLGKDLAKRGTIPLEDCVAIGLALTDALEFLHRQQLVHRDVKPSNVIFVNGVAKLADIGLVTEVRAKGIKMTYVGTQGYIAPEGPGTAAADIYSLGKVLYEMSMGRDRLEFPELPTSLGVRTDTAELLQLNAIILKACEEDPRRRYTSAAELHTDLRTLQSKLGSPRKP